MRKIALLLLFFFISFAPAAAQQLPVVTAIEINGLKRIEEGAVKAKLSQKIGDPVSQDRINEDIKSVFKMGYFDDVRVEIEAFEGGAKLIYRVKEKPTIVKIDFQGNKEIKEADLKEKITITVGAIADTVLIQDNAYKITKHYEAEGYWQTNVIPVVRKISDDEISLTYQIEEGTKVKIRKITIDGNSAISDRKIKKAMETKEWWLFSFVTSSGYYKKEQMGKDTDSIRNLYFNEGFIKVVIAEPEIIVDKNKKNMEIRIKIAEGSQYKVSSVDFTGNKEFDNETIRKKITLAQGRIFNKSVLEKDIFSISTLYSENGYALISVIPDLLPDDTAKTVQVLLNIEEGDKYRVGLISVSGNTKTRDKVIRREFRLDEGDVYDSSKLRRSYERINNLNFFEGVEMVPKPKQEEKVVDLDVQVKERPTGMLSVGGGYSSVDKFIATIDLTQGNLFGKGQYLKIKGELGGRSTFYELSFRDPWFLDRPVSFTTGLYRTTREYVEYDKKALGFYVGFGKSFAEYWRGDITYNFERATVYNVTHDLDNDPTGNFPGPEDVRGAPDIILEQEGTKITSSITTAVARDTRDNYLDPSRGSRNAVSFTFAGLGGSNAFIKGLLDSSWFFPWGETTFMFRGRFGYGSGIFGKELPLYERYYVGGIYTVRGLGFGEAGPKDEKTGDYIGGTEELILNAEYIFPVLPEMKLKGLVFFDAGNAYENFDSFGKLRYTTGLGARWISPIGPIRIEWGYNLDKRPGESSSKFEFAFGTFF